VGAVDQQHGTLAFCGKLSILATLGCLIIPAYQKTHRRELVFLCAYVRMQAAHGRAQPYTSPRLTRDSGPTQPRLTDRIRHSLKKLRYGKNAKLPYFCAGQHMQKVSILYGLPEHITCQKELVFLS
jgi:hypothetical protein